MQDFIIYSHDHVHNNNYANSHYVASTDVASFGMMVCIDYGHRLARLFPFMLYHSQSQSQNYFSEPYIINM